MSVRLADRSFQYPIGIAGNMLVEVGKITFLVDFVILKIEEDSKVPLILRRPFLDTADAVIRVKQKQLNLGVGTERMTFSIDSMMKHSYFNDDTCLSIDVIDEILEEDFDALLDDISPLSTQYFEANNAIVNDGMDSSSGITNVTSALESLGNTFGKESERLNLLLYRNGADVAISLESVRAISELVFVINILWFLFGKTGGVPRCCKLCQERLE
ncbi:reverse transcriptase domain-containing protein [Tanacetum coccineum]